MVRFTQLVILLLISLSVYIVDVKKEVRSLEDQVTKLEKNQEYLTTKIKSTDLNWLAMNIYHEARGETLEGMFAVGVVTLNRVKSDRYPNTIEGVVKQRNQFSWYWDGKSDTVLEMKSWSTAKSVARILLTNDDLIIRKKLKDVLFYHALYVRPKWASRFEEVAVIGNHKFYM